MKKFTALFAGLALAGSAYAAEMAPATFVTGYGMATEGAFVTNAYAVGFSWGGQEVHFTTDNPTFTLQKEGEEAVEMTSFYLGSYYYNAGDVATEAYCNLNYLYGNDETAGKYVVSIPAGVVANEEGDTNPAQSVTFTLVAGTLSSYAENFYCNPPQSISTNDYETGTSYPAPFYQASQLSEISIGWDGISLKPAGTGTVTAYLDYYDQKDISNLFTLKDGKFILDLSSFEPGTWNISIPEGLGMAETEDGIQINGQISLQYIILGELEPLGEPNVTYPRSDVHYLNSISSIQMEFGQPIALVEGVTPTYTHNGQTGNLQAAVSSDYYGVYTLTLKFAETMTSPGLYTINVPAGLVTNGQYANEAFSLEYFVLQYDEDYTVTPANKSSLSTSEFGKITVTFPGISKIEANEYNFEPIQVRGGSYGNYIYNYSLYLGNGVEIKDNTVVITVPEVNQVDYWVNINGNNFILDGLYSNPYINLEYYVWDGMAAATVLEAPATTHAVVPANARVLLTWDYQPLTLDESKKVTLVMGYDEIALGADAVKVVEVANPAGGTGYALSVDASAEVKAYIEDSNHYSHNAELTLPAGIVKNAEGMMSPIATFDFSAYEESPQPLLFAASSADEGIYFVYVDDCSWMSSPDYDSTLSLIDRAGNETSLTYDSDSYTMPAPGKFLRNYNADVNGVEMPAVMVNLSSIDDGAYSLLIPEGFVQFNIRTIGSFPDYTNVQTSFNVQIGEPQGEITIGEVVYSAYPSGTVTFIVPVESEGLAEGAEITVYYQGPNDQDFTAVSKNSHNEYTFDLTGLELDTKYSVDIYAASGSVQSAVKTVEFRTYVAVPNPGADILNAVAQNVTANTAELVVAYGFRDMPEGAKGYIYYDNGTVELIKAVDGTVYGANAVIELEDLTPGTAYTYTVKAVMESENGLVLAESQTETVTFTTEQSSAPVLEILSAEAQNIGSTIAEIAVKFTAANLPEGAVVTATATDEGTRTDTSATAENGNAVIELTGLTPETSYNYMVVLQADNADGSIITRSNIVYLQLTTLEDSGVDNILSDEDARYFTLDGVEISNPEAGTLCIKVVGSKATKVIVK